MENLLSVMTQIAYVVRRPTNAYPASTEQQRSTEYRAQNTLHIPIPVRVLRSNRTSTIGKRELVIFYVAEPSKR